MMSSNWASSLGELNACRKSSSSGLGGDAGHVQSVLCSLCFGVEDVAHGLHHGPRQATPITIP